MSSDVVFRRIHGRLVPIKINNKDQNKTNAATKDLLKAEIAGGAGIGLAVAAGRRAGADIKKAGHAAMKSRQMEAHAVKFGQLHKAETIARKGEQLKLFDNHAINNAGKARVRMRASARFSDLGDKLSSRGAKTRAAGRTGSALLLTYAAHKLLGHTKLKDNEPAREAASIGAGVAGTALVDTALRTKTEGYKSAGKFALKKVQQAFKFGIKKRFHL